MATSKLPKETVREIAEAVRDALLQGAPVPGDFEVEPTRAEKIDTMTRNVIGGKFKNYEEGLK